MDSKYNNGLNFTDTGNGNGGLVFLHYFGGSSNTWYQVIQKLKNEYRCIAVDLWGFGHSMASSEEFSINDNARSVTDVIASLQLKKFVLVGHSMGGKIALAVASFKPAGLEKIILVAPSPPTPEPMDEQERNQLLCAYNTPSALKRIINNITRKPLSDAEINKLIEDNLRTSQKAWISWIKNGSREDISSQMFNINVPVSVINGQYDKNLSGSFLHTEFVKYFPLANFQEIQEAGHLLPVENALSVSKAIRKALSGMQF